MDPGGGSMVVPVRTAFNFKSLQFGLHPSAGMAQQNRLAAGPMWRQACLLQCFGKQPTRLPLQAQFTGGNLRIRKLVSVLTIPVNICAVVNWPPMELLATASWFGFSFGFHCSR